ANHAGIRARQQCAAREVIMRHLRIPPIAAADPRTQPERTFISAAHAFAAMERKTTPPRRHRLPHTVFHSTKTKRKTFMLRIGLAVFVFETLACLPARAQQIDTSLSDRQIIANIIKECRDLYMKSVGACACADDRHKDGTRCNKVIKDLPESFKPFCTRKDVSL